MEALFLTWQCIVQHAPKDFAIANHAAAACSSDQEEHCKTRQRNRIGDLTKMQLDMKSNECGAQGGMTCLLPATLRECELLCAVALCTIERSLPRRAGADARIVPPPLGRLLLRSPLCACLAQPRLPAPAVANSSLFISHHPVMRVHLYYS